MTLMIMASYKIFYLLFISCHVWYELYPFYPSEAASLPPTNTTASASQDEGKGGISSLTIVAIVVYISVAVLIFMVGIFCFNKRTRKKYDSDPEEQFAIGISNLDSLKYDFRTLEAATNNFSVDNKLGRGEFGEVYKGMLLNGQEIAVKRLSVSSRQGDEEFKNEVEVLARLQHRNLVRLLGFCMQEEEKILVFEYMPNKSLDYILFDPEKQRQLDWTQRYKIVKGIAQGIQYLHNDSRLRIIHRDLKVNNILLDSDMNPKLSDFGLAITFTFDQTQGNADRICGTYAYMPPEYALYGDISVKCDVYSFGVLLMEIISGKRKTSFHTEDGMKDIRSYAWGLWEDGEAMEMLDPTIRESCNQNEVMRCIHISLLCVQDDPADRPSMSSVLLMLENYSMTLPTPFTTLDLKMQRDFQFGQSTTKLISMSVNDMSVSEVIPR